MTARTAAGVSAERESGTRGEFHREDVIESEGTSRRIWRSRTFLARMSALSEVVAFTAEACRDADLGREVCLRLTLLVEELFSNTVVHGHAGGSDAPVTVTLDAERGRITLTYEDTGPPHDPFAAVVQPDGAATVEDWPVGGLGVFLVASMATDIEYRRIDDKNRIALTIRSSS